MFHFSFLEWHTNSYIFCHNVYCNCLVVWFLSFARVNIHIYTYSQHWCYMSVTLHERWLNCKKKKKKNLQFYPLQSQLGFLVCLFVCLFVLRERKLESGGGAEPEGERENPKGAPYYRRKVQWGTRTHKLWDHDLNPSWMLNQLSHPGAPPKLVLIIYIL